MVLGLPRGGVAVAFEAARALDAPLDVIVVRRLGVPFHPELGMGAIGEGGVRVLHDEVMWRSGVTVAELAEAEARQRAELDRQARLYRGGRARADVSGRTAVLVDDGIKTGSTADVACCVARAQGADRVVLAVPVAPPEVLERLRESVDELVCLEEPNPFGTIGQSYREFAQLPDSAVVDLLRRAERAHPAPTVEDPRVLVRDEEVEVAADGVRLGAHLAVPERASGIVVFAHSSATSRHGAGSRYVAGVFHRAGLGTLLVDLLSGGEEYDRDTVFDLELLGRRLLDVTAWLRTRREAELIGYFGAGVGAAAALWAAAQESVGVTAVVSRGGRPDLAADRLAEVRAATLLIVGGRDDAMLDLHRRAQDLLRCEHRLAVVPSATHDFEEEGTFDAAAGLATEWFLRYLAPVRAG